MKRRQEQDGTEKVTFKTYAWMRATDRDYALVKASYYVGRMAEVLANDAYIVSEFLEDVKAADKRDGNGFWLVTFELTYQGDEDERIEWESELRLGLAIALAATKGTNDDDYKRFVEEFKSNLEVH